MLIFLSGFGGEDTTQSLSKKFQRELPSSFVSTRLLPQHRNHSDGVDTTNAAATIIYVDTGACIAMDPTSTSPVLLH